MYLEDEAMREVKPNEIDDAIKQAYSPAGAPVQDAAANQQPAQTTTQHMGQPPAETGVPGATPAPSATPAAPAKQDAPLTQDQNPKQIEQPAVQAPTEADFFKFKSNDKYDSWEKIVADLEKPPVEKIVEKEVIVAQPLEFKTPEAKAVYEAIAEEQYEKVLPFLEQKKFVANLETMAPEEIVKAKLRMEYPSLDADDIQAEFDALYKPDENQLSANDFARAQKKAADKLKRDASTAKEDLKKINVKLELPKPAAAQQPQAPVQSEEVKSIISLGKSYVKDFEAFPFEYESPDKSRQVKGQYQLPATEVDALTAQIAKNPEAFLAGWFDRYSQANGELNPKAIAKDVLAITKLTSGEITNQVARASSEQTFEGKLKQDRNYNPDATRHAASPMPGKDEADKAAMLAFAGVPQKK